MTSTASTANALANAPQVVASGGPENVCAEGVRAARSAQAQWSRLPVAERLKVVRSFRQLLAARSAEFVRAAGPADEIEAAEILASQILPLADACRFLERQAVRLLSEGDAPGASPLWLSGSSVRIQREPHGIVLVVAASNYPLLLPGVITLQALVAGNAVILKPGFGGTAAAKVIASALYESHLWRGLVQVVGEATGAVRDSIAAGVDKVVMTGSATAGKRVLAELAPRLIPATLELSGVDAMFVRADASVETAARALLFGLRLNRGATCIAPRRLFAHEAIAPALEREIQRLWHREADSTWELDSDRDAQLAPYIRGAVNTGARIIAGQVGLSRRTVAPVVLADAVPSMRVLREDHFGPVAGIVTVANDEEALAANEACPYALGASIFTADEAAGRAMANRIRAGTVVINDLIVPTADPRVPFGGRRESGYGVTRGAEGLLEMTVPKAVICRKGRSRLHYDAPAFGDAELFAHYLSAAHGAEFLSRARACISFVRSIWRKNHDSKR